VNTRARKLSASFVAVAISGLLSACATTANVAATGGDGKLALRYQGWANQVTLPELAENLGYFSKVKLNWVGNTISGPQDIQSAATNQTDFGGAFSGAVVKLIEAKAAIKGVINYYGSDDKSFIGYYVKEDSPIRTARDLIGKSIAVNTLGAHSEAVIDSYLEKNGLTPEEIKKVQLVVVPPNNTEDAIRKGQVDVGALNGPLQDHAIATGGVRALFSDVKLFGAFNGGQYVLRTDFIERHPAEAKDFVTGVAKAIEWERTTPREDVIAKFKAILSARGRQDSTDTVQYWKSVGVPSKGGLIVDEDFTRWSGWLTTTGIVAGPIDAKKYYTNEFNGLAGGAS
jgi:ABC-type nitrate/sulfonate/bicarbonate transport system substrate-binding protein